MRVALLTLLSLGCAADDFAPATRARPIVHGSPDPTTEAVVALVGPGGVYCSGTLVAPRFVVTAAHCLGATPPAVDLGSRGSIATLDFRLHPAFDPVALSHDLAVLHLAAPAPPEIVPASVDVTGPELEGALVRVIGFGATETPGAAERHQGTARVTQATPAELRLAPEPAQPCNGDSGGAVFADRDGAPALVGVISHGDAGCAEWSAASRLDDFVEAAQEEMVVVDQPVGARCVEDGECAGALCLFPEDAPTIGYCSAACAGDADCPASMSCDGLCRHPLPSPGALGVECERDSDCDGRLCAAGEEGVSVCSTTCLPGHALSCPEALVCAERLDAPGFACLPPPVPAGCAVAGPARSPPLPFLLVFGLVLVISTKRRTP